MTLSVIALVVFVIFAFVHLAVEALRFRTGRYLTKPFLMPLLTLYYVTSAQQPNYFLMAALGCGWLGDVFLMIPEAKETRRYFMVGVSAFVLGHIFYMVVFAGYLPQFGNIPGWGWGVLTAYVAAGIFGYRILSFHAGEMRPVVILYIMVIVLMGASSILPLGSANTAGVLAAMAGAFAFMLSDLINACNRFVRKVPLEWLLIMGFYLAGQFLLIHGFLLF